MFLTRLSPSPLKGHFKIPVPRPSPQPCPCTISLTNVHNATVPCIHRSHSCLLNVIWLIPCFLCETQITTSSHQNDIQFSEFYSCQTSVCRLRLLHKYHVWKELKAALMKPLYPFVFVLSLSYKRRCSSWKPIRFSLWLLEESVLICGTNILAWWRRSVKEVSHDYLWGIVAWAPGGQRLSHVLGKRWSDTIVQTPYGVFSSSNRSEMSSALTSTLHNHAQLSEVTRGKKKKKGLCFMKPWRLGLEIISILCGLSPFFFTMYSTLLGVRCFSLQSWLQAEREDGWALHLQLCPI